MTYRQFDIHQNFYLHTNGWEQGRIQDVIKLLDSVITDFYANFDLEQIIEKPIYVINSKNKIPPSNCPTFVKQNECNRIYLNTVNRLWCQYSYQFSHELCHHIIDSDFLTTNDRFGWFEESLCELASIFCIDKMAQTWLTNPPYSNWKEYSNSLAGYVRDIIEKSENKIVQPFKIWLAKRMDELYNDRYKRAENRIVALQLFPLFKNEPEFWSSIQYLKRIKVTDKMSFDNFMDAWTESVPEKMREMLNEIKITLH
ncbi:MAG: hypothetical protein LBE82_05590 [Chitinophagaceae bacterium]|jgi:hypothetical protein|nr:hypothetical protein [Chitinophagaceae bacterium]